MKNRNSKVKSIVEKILPKELGGHGVWGQYTKKVHKGIITSTERNRWT